MNLKDWNLENVKPYYVVGAILPANKACGWSVIVSVNGKVRNFGRFDTPEEAFQAYKQAKTSLAKNLAEKWKGKIDDRVYFSLLNYIVEEKD